MNYLILECPNKSSSEYQFWSETLGFSGTIVCCGGNTHMFRTIKQLELQLNMYDNIFVFYDSINVYSSVQEPIVKSNLNALLGVLHTLKNRGYNCYICKDLCFESMIYRLSRIIGVHNHKLQCELSYVFKNNVAYDKNLCSILRNCSQNCTCEQYVASELHNVTCGTPLLCDKGKLGYCWCSTCGVADNKAFCYMNKDNLLQCWNTNKVATTTLCGRILSADTKLYFQLMHKKGYKREVIYKELGVTSWEGLFRQI